jgi:hypothetical protein
MRVNAILIAVILVLIFTLGYVSGRYVEKPTETVVKKEGFESGSVVVPRCQACGGSCPCKCGANSRPTCPPCREPDLSKYVLKSTIPPCPQCPDMSQYMLKTECPPAPDLSKYVLKSSIPKPQPVIIDNSACKKECGECPPCPRPRCPDMKCPPPTKCPPPAPCPRPVCPPPPTKVKCVAEDNSKYNVRPYLAPLDFDAFGKN